MIKITMEIFPHGVEEDKYFMGEMGIENIGKDTVGNSIYTYYLMDRDKKVLDGGITVHNRLDGFMYLIKKIWKDHIKVKSDLEVTFEKRQYPAIRNIDTKTIASDLVSHKPND